MTLWVHSFCGYPSYAGTGAEWQPDDYDALNIVRAVKGHDLKKGFTKIKSRSGSLVTVDNSRKGAAKLLFGEWAAAKVAELGLRAPRLVAVPSSDCLAYDSDVKGIALSRAVATRVPGSQSLSVLRWVEQFPKAAEGGPRDVATLKPNLRVRAGLDAGEFVLIDDVVTSGGHAKACAQLLREFGHTVSHVLAVAHTVQQRPGAGMFAIESFDLEAPFDWDAF